MLQHNCYHAWEDLAIKAKYVGIALFLPLLLGAQEAPTQADFQACYGRNKAAYVTLEGVRALAITPTRAVAHDRPRNFLKYDPFLNVYVIASSSLSPIPQNEERALRRGEWLASVDANGAVSIGKLDSLGSGLGSFDTFSATSTRGAAATGVCCDMYGLARGGGSFIGNRYLEHAVAYDEVYYGDVKARFGVRDGAVIVTEVHPFFSTPLRNGDRILRIDGAQVEQLRTVQEAILFAPKGSSVRVEVARGAQTLRLNLPVTPKPLIPIALETYLEPLGMHFDAGLVLRRVEGNLRAKTQGLEVGDRLLEINRQPVASPQALRTLLATLPKNQTHHMLFDRKGFHFFITLEIP